MTIMTRGCHTVVRARSSRIPTRSRCPGSVGGPDASRCSLVGLDQMRPVGCSSGECSIGGGHPGVELGDESEVDAVGDPHVRRVAQAGSTARRTVTCSIPVGSSAVGPASQSSVADAARVERIASCVIAETLSRALLASAASSLGRYGFYSKNTRHHDTACCPHDAPRRCRRSSSREGARRVRRGQNR